MKYTVIGLTALLCCSVYAKDVEIIGTTKHVLHSSTNLLKGARGAEKEISLLTIKLTDQAQAAISARASAIFNQQDTLKTKAGFPTKVKLSMSNVPVLDQGQFGSCVTFAVTAAIDAALKKGDYISQLCALQLGNYFELHGYTPSGWNGTDGGLVLSHLRDFGVVSKTKEAQGCGGLTSYPDRGDVPTSSMSLEEYAAQSEPLNPNKIGWSTLLDTYQTYWDLASTSKVFNEVKSALAAGDRVVFGVLLTDLEEGVMGAVGSYRRTNDTWVLTRPIIRTIAIHTVFGGHDMIITGYDDFAIARDREGRIHRGILTLRNSWGPEVGDQGDFYMSYDYFRALVIEAERIRARNVTA